MTPALNELSLFSGLGGFTMGLRLSGVSVRTVCYVEIDPYCQQVIQARIHDRLLDDAPIWPDIRTFPARDLAGLVDIVTAGFPCQPFSPAGKRRGPTDERNLWHETLRVIREVEPEWVLLENSEALTFKPHLYARVVVNDLATSGYDSVWDCVPAYAVGAPHGRWRWWCLAHSTKKRRGPWWRPTPDAQPRDAALPFIGPDGQTQLVAGLVADRNQAGQQELCRLPADAEPPGRNQPGSGSWWTSSTTIRRVDDGLPCPLDVPASTTDGELATVAWSVEQTRQERIKALGNSLVLPVVERFLAE